MVEFTETSINNARLATPLTCGYSVTYTVKWRNYYETKIPLPDWIIWNPTDFRYEVYTD
jgi:hypothetical protein